MTCLPAMPCCHALLPCPSWCSAPPLPPAPFSHLARLPGSLRRRRQPGGFSAQEPDAGDRSPVRPCLNMPPTEIFSKFQSRKNRKYPPLMGPKLKNFISKIWSSGGFLGRFKQFTGTPDPFFSLGAPFAGRGGAVSGPQRRRFIFPGGQGARFWLPVSPAGEVSQGKGDGTMS
jgi:hypothetical protein